MTKSTTQFIHDVNKETLKKVLAKYMMESFEYEEEKAYDELVTIMHNSCFPVGYTTHGDNEELEVEVTLSLPAMSLQYDVRGATLEKKAMIPFDQGVEEMITFFDANDFDTVVYYADRLNVLDYDAILEEEIGSKV